MRSFFEIANDLEPGAWIRVYYNSARSEERQEARGKVRKVVVRKEGTKKIIFDRPDGQTMTLHGDSRLVSRGSHFPTTGYAYRVETKIATEA